MLPSFIDPKILQFRLNGSSEFLACQFRNVVNKISCYWRFHILHNNKTVLNCMTSRGFTQYVDVPTTENGTLIDHVYAKGCEHIKVQSVPTYYSDHEAI